METAIVNLIEPGDQVIVAMKGLLNISGSLAIDVKDGYRHQGEGMFRKACPSVDRPIAHMAFNHPAKRFIQQLLG